MARKRHGRKIDGILLLDKPAGLSSNQALQRVKRLLQAQKAGHTGTLDGPATGLLPLCFGEATKMSTYLLNARKSYRCEVRLGTTTTTLDAAGDVVQTRPVPPYSAADLEKIFARFRGIIEQIPPMYSALKYQGERLYKLATLGIEIKRNPRRVEIYRLEASHLESGSFTLDVECSKGTYIRTLAADIGEILGCGAHVLSLRRLTAGSFNLTEAHTLEQLDTLYANSPESLDKLLLPVDAGLSEMPVIRLSEDKAHYFLHGQPVGPVANEEAGLVRVYEQTSKFLGIAEVLSDGSIAPKRLIAANY